MRKLELQPAEARQCCLSSGWWLHVFSCRAIAKTTGWQVRAEHFSLMCSMILFPFWSEKMTNRYLTLESMRNQPREQILAALPLGLVLRRLSGPTQKTLLVGPLECKVLKGLYDKVLRGASQGQHSVGQIQGEFCLVLAPSWSQWCQPRWGMMMVPAEHHSGHHGPFSWIDYGDAAPLYALAQFWIFCLSFTFRFLSTLAPELGKEKLKKQKL